MEGNEQSGLQEYWDSFSESEREALRKGLHAMAKLTNSTNVDGSSATVEESAGSASVMDADKFWDSYGKNIVALANYIKYGRVSPEDGLDVYRPGLVQGPEGLEPSFILKRAARRRPELL